MNVSHPLRGLPLTLDTLRLLSHDEGGCWMWDGSRDRDGYGVWGIHRIHRLSYSLAHDYRLTSTESVLHSCDNPPCFNPAHLSVGTSIENRQQCVQRSRQARGEDHGLSKLTVEQVRWARSEMAIGTLPRVVAATLGVSYPCISRIKRGVTWKHVGGTA